MLTIMHADLDLFEHGLTLATPPDAVDQFRSPWTMSHASSPCGHYQPLAQRACHRDMLRSRVPRLAHQN